jgi:ABC-type uncharacterized transport system ATPase subunit
MKTPLVELRGIRKRFGPVVALDGADFELRAGEIHGLLGENGAGKTTLMNVLAGLYRADAGEVYLDGRPVQILEPRDAVRVGVGMVHQHFELVGHFSALENVVLGREGGGWLRRHRRQILAGRRSGYYEMRPGAGFGFIPPKNVPPEVARKTQEIWRAVVLRQERIEEVTDRIVERR